MKLINSDVIWKNIKFAPNYQVANIGLIRNKKTKKLISPHIVGAGYYSVGLYIKNKRVHKYIHRLVLATFYKSKDLDVNHKNGKKFDNRLSNLEYITKKQNMQHAVKLGLHKGPINPAKGEKNGSAKLNKNVVLKIREMRNRNFSYQEIANKYSISVSQVRRIVSNLSWKF